METTIEAARRYLSMGWSVLPDWGVENGQCGCRNINCTSVGKHPALTEWTTYFNRLPRDEELESWFSDGSKNVGIICGEISDNLIVIDTDDPITYHALCYVYPELSESLTSRTGNGYHIYTYSEEKVQTAPWRLNGKTHHVKGEHSKVTAPPSTHYSGRVYQFLEPDAAPLMVDLPRLRDALATLGAVGRKPQDEEGNHERGRAAQIFRDGAHAGERDEHTFYLAASLSHYGLPWDFKEAILSLWAEQRCDQRPGDPWGTDQIRAKLRAVARYEATGQGA